MSAMDWDEVDEVFQAALELAKPDRSAFLELRCGEATDLRAQVESLISAHDSSPGFLAPLGAVGDLGPAFADAPQPGSVVGAYRLVRELGQGGMGTVFLATRADGTFEHEVAVKITRGPVSDRSVARRFQAERQILASLRHPHIVSLIDGGTSASGHAYLVMEYVDGSPMTRWLRDRNASLEQRLRLFRQVCSAVHVAHQHGIVHRDLKPGNVFVTGDGVPKVLDFGVAKLLESDGVAGSTVTGLLPGPLTPNYASPEQLRGLPVTTACDVYSLGVLLYEILAGARPYETAGKTVDQLLEQVLHTPIRRVSAAAAGPEGLPYPATRLRGDVDAIVQKAMHVEPAHRYASAEELSDDVARFLGGKPIVAREPSLGYVLRKLAAQHRGVVTAAVVGLAGVLVALGIALWQRQVAIDERARADARFNDVRQLANALIFKVHDAVVRLPGTTEVRKLIVTEALGYLDKLAATSSDPTLRLELAKGYTQVARAMGDPSIANLGDYPAAMANLRRSLEILEPLRASPAWREAGLQAVLVLRTTAMVEWSVGQKEQAVATAHRALEEAEALARLAPTDDDLRRTLASAHFNVASSFSHDAEAAPHWEAAGKLFEALWQEKPDDPDRMRNVALVDKYYGRLLLDQGRLEDGMSRYRRALDLDEKRLAMRPGFRQSQFDVAIDLANMGAGLTQLDRTEEALTYYERSISMREQLVASDEKDRSARLALVRVLTTAARLHLQNGDSAQARRRLDRVAEIEATDQGLKDDRTFQRDRVKGLTIEARLALDAGQRSQACAVYSRAMRLAGEVYPRKDWDPQDRTWFEASERALGTCATP
jgi:non-specific serine/threonine protein kinase/serine/threonine-protein kinase